MLDIGGAGLLAVSASQGLRARDHAVPDVDETAAIANVGVSGRPRVEGRRNMGLLASGDVVC